MTVEDQIAQAVAAQVRQVVREELAKLAPQPEPSPFLSTAKAAELCDCHADTLRAAIKAGELREFRAGRELRIRRADLEAWLASGRGNGQRPEPEEEAEAMLRKRR